MILFYTQKQYSSTKANQDPRQLIYQSQPRPKATQRGTAIDFENAALKNIRNVLQKGNPSAKTFSKAIVLQVAEVTCEEDVTTKRGWVAEH
jgi:hypothetical protein